MHNQGLRVHEKVPFPRRWIHMALQKVPKGRICGRITGLSCMPEPCSMPETSVSWLGCVFSSPTLQDHAHILPGERVASAWPAAAPSLSSKQSVLFRLSARSFHLSSVLLLFYRYHKMQFWPFCPQQAIHLKYKCCPQTAVINMRQQILFFVLYCWFPPIGKLGGRRTA